MKCPYCGYKHGWYIYLSKDIQGEKGDFYVLPIKLKRESWSDDQKLFGCPRCGKVFMDV